jgi:signal transduction histidine kinase
MKDNLIVTPDNMAVFERSLDMIDTSIRELRRVAHNMMPEALVKFGLQQAVQDYCDSLQETKQYKISCHFHEIDKRIEPTTEIIVYRIIQELLNNVVKHAQASEVLVQVMRHNDNLNITIEDNGKGFDISGIEHAKGAGLHNVRSRVDYLKGHMDIRSEPGKGTSVHIDCNLTD